MDTLTHRALFPDILPRERVRLCMTCKSAGVAKVIDSGRAQYVCSACGTRSERFLAWDPSMVQYFNASAELVHASVGVVVQNSAGKVLLFKRVQYPFLWTIPAGHLEVNEHPHLAAIRELHEETGIVVSATTLLFEGNIQGDSCVGGADIHAWHLYHAVVHDVLPVIEKEEGDAWQWSDIDTLPRDLTYPVAYLFAQENVVRALSCRE